MSASTTRQVRHKIPLPLSIVARPHEAGPILSWRADSLALVWLDSGITPCCKSLFAGRDTNFPSCRCDNRMIMWGTTSSCDELTGDFGGGPETTSIDDCRLFLSFCGKLVARHFGTFPMLSANKRLMHRSKIVRPTASL